MSGKGHKTFLILIGALVFLCLGGLLALLLTPLPEWLANRAVDWFLERPLGADIHIGDVGGNLFQRLSFQEVEVRMEEGRIRAHVRAVSLQYDWARLARRRWHLQKVGLQKPVIYLTPSGKTAPQAAAAETSAAPRMVPAIPAFEVDHLTVTGGRLESPAGVQVDDLGLEVSIRAKESQAQLQIDRCHLLLPQRGGLALRNLSADLAFSPHRVEVARLGAETGSSRVGTCGRILVAPVFSCSLEVWADSLSLDEMGLALEMAHPLRGDLVLAGQVQGDASSWKGKARLNGRAEGYDISDLRANFDWRGGKLQLDSLSLESPGVNIQGCGYLQTGAEDPAFGADLNLQQVNLSAILDQAPPSQLTGRLLVSGSGLTPQTIRAVADLDLKAGVMAERSFQGIRGQIIFDRGLLFVERGLEVDLDGAHLFLAGSLDADQHLDAWADVEVTDLDRLLGRPGLAGSLRARCQAMGPVADPALAGQFRLRDLVHRGQRLRRVQGNFGLSGAVSREEGFFSLRFFDGGVGNLSVDEGLVRGRFAGQKVFLDSVAIESPQGQLAAVGQLSLVEDGLEVQVDPLQGVYRGYNFTNSGPLRLFYGDGLVRLEESQLLLEAGSIQIQGTLGPSSNIQGSARLQDVQMESLSQLLSSGHQLTGPVSLEVALEGSTAAPVGRASLRWEKGSFDQVTFDQIEARMAYADGRLTVEQFRAQRGESLFRGQGYIPVDLPNGKLLTGDSWDLAFFGEGSSLALLSLLVKEVEDVNGPFTIQLHATGTPRQPRYEGFFNLHDGTLKLAPLGNSIRNLAVQARLEGHFLVIDRLEGETPSRERNFFKRIWAKLFPSKRGGRFGVFGRINLADTAFDLTLEGKKLYVDYREEQVEAELDAQLRMRGQKVPQFSGQVALRRCLISRSFTAPSRVATPAEPPAYGLDLTIQIPKNCWLRNDAANVELRGQMRVLQQGGQLSLLGNLETIRGTYFFYGNNFRIERGLVTFDQLAEIDPQLDVKAWTEVNQERIYLIIGGRLRVPTITLTSSSGYGERDIIALLTLHQSPAGLDTLGAEEIVRSQAAGFFGTFLQQELNRKAGSTLGVDKFRIKPGSSGGLGLKGAEITVGTYLSSEIYVEYSRDLSLESGEQVGVEYSLSRNLSLQGYRDKKGLYRLGLSLKWDY